MGWKSRTKEHLMTKRTWLPLWLLVGTGILTTARPAGAQTLDEAAVDGIVRDAMKAWQVPGAAVAIVHNDRVIYLKGFGVRELGKDAGVTPDTLFAIASTSKAFTTTAMAMLVDEGKMSWDDPVRKHLEYFRLADPLASEQVTLRDLVCHRTGLSRHDWLWVGPEWSREELIRRIGHVPLTKPFRSTYQYQNIMYLTAGQAVGAASGGTWEEFVQKRIFDPLGMRGACFSTTVAEKAADHATPHVKKKDKDQLTTISWRNIDNVAPAGSINAGVRDLSQWLRFQLGDGSFEGKRLVSPVNMAQMHTPQVVIPMDNSSLVSSFTRLMNPETNLLNYGLGWVIQDYRGQLVVSHGGSLDGFRSQVALLPKARLGVAILSNLGRTQFPEAVRNNLLDHYLGGEKRNWNGYYTIQQLNLTDIQEKADQQRLDKRHKDTKPSLPLTAYAGTFRNATYGDVAMTLENGGLHLRWGRLRLPLEHFHFDTFSINGDEVLGSQSIVFNLDANGEVSKLSFLEQEFKRSR
jgi:CubicO group peptidase (beta-lactamase class C family)